MQQLKPIDFKSRRAGVKSSAIGREAGAYVVGAFYESDDRKASEVIRAMTSL